MRIQHNIMAMNAYRNYNTNTSALSKNLEKLSSGYKINRAGDDAAGLAISEKMRAQITGLNAAQKNVKDGISLVKTGEGAMQEIQDMLNRMDYLATQSANGTYDNDVDRKNLQKEVDALKSEINRIADSANFNGIKLLDGKAGINTTAFSFDSVSGTSAQAGGTVAITFAAAASGATEYHLTEDGVTAQAPEFAINLDNLEIDLTNIAGTQAVFTVTIGTSAYAVTFTKAGGSSGKYSTEQIADAIVTAMNSTAISGGATGAQFGGYVFKAAKDGTNAVKFTLMAKGTGNVAEAFGADDIVKGTDDTALNALNGVKGGAVSIGTTDTDAIMKGEYNHDVDDVQKAIAKEEGKRAGITFELNPALMTDGSTLTIDGVTFTFKVGASSAVTATTNVIDLTKMPANATSAQLVEEAINQLSNQTAGKFDIEKKDATHIHIDQTSASYAAGDKFKTDGELKAVVQAAGAATPAVNAGTSIKADATKVADGDKLKIGDYTFVFTSDASKVDTSNKEIQVNGKDAAALQAAINGSTSTTGLVADAALTSDGAVVVRTNSTTNTAAPVISGTGLMLQIGDTSDSYNRLAVKIGDMHVSAMKDDKTNTSIADIDIGNPEGAANAIQTIRSAINYVSGVRGDLGAIQNRLEHTANNLSVMAENIQDAESTIRDTDVAEEMMAYTKNNILVQSAQAMLAQANAVPQGVLQLLG